MLYVPRGAILGHFPANRSPEAVEVPPSLSYALCHSQVQAPKRIPPAKGDILFALA